MPNEDLSKRHFQKKISTYCDVRIVPVAPDPERFHRWQFISPSPITPTTSWNRQRKHGMQSVLAPIRRRSRCRQRSPAFALLPWAIWRRHRGPQAGNPTGRSSQTSSFETLSGDQARHICRKRTFIARRWKRVSWDREMGHSFETGPQSAVGQCHHQAAGGNGWIGRGEFSAHGLRSGYLTEAVKRGIPLQEALEQSKHRSVLQASC